MKLNKYHYHDKYNNFSTVHLQECEGIDIYLIRRVPVTLPRDG